MAPVYPAAGGTNEAFGCGGQGDTGLVPHTQPLAQTPVGFGPADVASRHAATVVIATRNRLAELRRTLQRLAALPERPPVIVVDNASDDGTPDMVRREFPTAGLIALRRNLGACARNVGARAARTPLIALTDDDSWWAPDALTRAATVLAGNPRVGLVAARILVGAEQADDPVNVAMASSPLPSNGLPGPRVLGFLGCGAVLRRDAYLAAGGFSRLLFFGGEEQLLAYDLAAAGWTACYRADIVAYHHPSAVRDAARRRSQTARNRALVAWLRRPARCALAETGRLIRACVRMPLALAGRRPLPPDIEQAIRMLGADHAG
jgi:GT2 family glycosyltransferase